VGAFDQRASPSTQPGNLEHGGTVRKHQTGSTLAQTGPIALESAPVASSKHEKKGLGTKLKETLGLEHKQHTADSSSAAPHSADGHHATQPGNLEHGGTVRKHQTRATLAHTGPIALESAPAAPATAATSSEHEKKGVGAKLKETLGLDHKQHAVDSSGAARTNDGRAY
jgi:hypothetical protein